MIITIASVGVSSTFGRQYTIKSINKYSSLQHINVLEDNLSSVTSQYTCKEYT